MVAKTKAEEAGRLNDLSLDLSEGAVAIASQYFVKIAEELLGNAIRYSKSRNPHTRKLE